MASLFSVPNRASKTVDSTIAKKSKSTKKKSSVAVKSGGGLFDKINTIKALVERNLGQYADETLIIQDEQILSDYIDRCIENGICAIDTETTGLDPLLDEIVGIGIYTPGEKTTYIPLNHISFITMQRIESQLSVDAVRAHLERLRDAKTDIDMFNATFDTRVIKHATDVRLKCTWDAYLGSRCLNENEPYQGLKKLHQKYILKGEEDAFKFDDLFKGIDFRLIPIKTAGLYGAHDPKITYEYAEYQRGVFKRKDNLKDVEWVFKNIEMPVVDVVVDIEDTGVEFDFEYNEKLKGKYHAILDEKREAFIKSYQPYMKDIRALDSNKLEDPINVASVQQLQILLYDILGLPLYYDKKKRKETRSTSKDALSKLDNPVAKAILEYREFATLVDVFIDKLPECVNPNDGRIHCKFNQYGADTGRFSSQDPNLQNIPSHNKDIRKMFKATDGYVLMSSDYSQQEPKVMAQLCGDERMLQAYREGKDLYAEIASLSFNTTYDNCLEFRPDGTTNPEGKARRSQAKSILLGVLYGRGVPSIAEQLGTTPEKAQKIKDSVFKGFPAIEEFERDSITMAEELGYVTTLWGRKRRLPAMMLPDFEFEWMNGKSKDFDPLNFDSDECADEVPDYLVEKYYRKLMHSQPGKRKKIFEQANKEGIKVIDNTRNKDTTKVVNARIQGSAADMSKLAMIKLGNDERLKELGFRMLITIHDEIIAECPEENMKECAERFAHLMSIAASDRLTIPISCDVAITKCWYGEEIKL